MDLEIGDALIEVIGGYQFRIPAGTSKTIGSGPQTDVRIEHSSVAPLHLRIDNKVTFPGYPASHPYSSMVLVTDIGGASSGADMFGPGGSKQTDGPSRTGVVKDLERGFLMPLELHEMAPMSNGTVVVFGDLQLRLVTGG